MQFFFFRNCTHILIRTQKKKFEDTFLVKIASKGTSLNLNNPESTFFIDFKMTNVASGDQEIVNSLIGNDNKKINAKFIMFYRTYSGLALLISKAQAGTYVAIANDGSSSIKPDLKFPSSKSKCTDMIKWHIILVTWSDKGENLSNCWSNSEKLITFTTENIEGSNHCYIGDLGKIVVLAKSLVSIGDKR